MTKPIWQNGERDVLELRLAEQVRLEVLDLRRQRVELVLERQRCRQRLLHGESLDLGEHCSALVQILAGTTLLDQLRQFGIRSAAGIVVGAFVEAEPVGHARIGTTGPGRHQHVELLLLGKELRADFSDGAAGELQLDADLAELILNHLAAPHRVLIGVAADRHFQPVLVAGLGEQLLRLLRIIRIGAGDVLGIGPVGARQRHPGRLAKATERRLDEGVAIEREVDCLADLDVVERSARVVEIHLDAIQRRRRHQLEILGALDHRLQPRRQLERHVVLTGDHRAQRGRILRDDVELDAVQEWPALAPVVFVAGDDDDLVIVPAHELPRAGANRLPIGVVAERLDIGRRHHHAGAIRQDRRQRRVGIFQLQRHLQRAGDFDAVDAGQVRLDVGALVGAVAIEVELHRLGVERRTVVEFDALGDVQHHGVRIGIRPLREARLRLQGVVVPLHQGVVDRPQDAVIGAGAAGRRIKRRRIGGRRDFQNATGLGGERLPRQPEHAGRSSATKQRQNLATAQRAFTEIDHAHVGSPMIVVFCACR